MTVRVLLAIWLVYSPAGIAAQSVAARHLDRPDRRFQQSFSAISGIRELRDGRVIIVDENERGIYVLDPGWSRVDTVGRNGSGPGEYLLPTRLLALAGDSTAAWDGPNNRYLVLSPDAVPAGILDPYGRPPGARALASHLTPPRATDRHGAFYSQALPVARTATRSQLVDSAAIERWDAASTARDTVAFIPFRDKSRFRIAGNIVVRVDGEPEPFPSRPQFAVARDGWIAIVHDEPYHVDFIESSGIRRAGPVIPYKSIRLTEAHKTQWCAERERPTAWLSGRRGGGPPTISMRRLPCKPPANWPDELPPFLAEAAMFSPDGRLWVRRTISAEEPATFDVIDRTGHIVERITLPARRELAGFGARFLYVVFRNELDLEYLERYRF